MNFVKAHKLTELVCFWLRRNYGVDPKFHTQNGSNCIVISYNDVNPMFPRVIVYDEGWIGKRAHLSNIEKGPVVLERVVVCVFSAAVRDDDKFMVVDYCWLDPCCPGFFDRLGVVLDPFLVGEFGG